MEGPTSGSVDGSPAAGQTDRAVDTVPKSPPPLRMAGGSSCRVLDDPHALATARTDASPRARDQTGISGRDASSHQAGGDRSVGLEERARSISGQPVLPRRACPNPSLDQGSDHRAVAIT